LKYGECLVNKVKEQNSPYYILKLKKKEDQSMDTLFLLRRGNKIPMEGVTETKCEAETEGMSLQRLPNLEIHPINNHQNQTLSHMPARFCRQDPDKSISCEAMPVPGNYRRGCLQSSLGWNIGPPMKKLEKVPKELKGSATLEEEQQYELTSTCQSSCL
jgi:hypothetical protein